MPSREYFSGPLLAAVADSGIVGVRAGDEHRFTGVWVVVVRGRVFVRPWNAKSTGWHRAFADEPNGAMQVGQRVIKVRAKRTRGERLYDEVDAAYAAKYSTPASRKWVRGFALPQRRATTTELVPR
jgi:hypothetical protein